MSDHTTHVTSIAYHLLQWVGWLRNSKVSACLAVLGSMYMYMFGAAPARAAVQPAITAVTTDYQVSPPTITITGRYFGTITPSVTLDGAPLVVVTYTQTQVTALLPASLNPGSYQVALTNNSLALQTAFDATIGAVGPEGPAGPAGPTGAAGPPGPTGPKGATGATGPAGPRGATGATGATGPAGLAGPQGPQGPQGGTGPTGPTGPQGLTWQGAWNNSATYNLNDAVGYNGSSYISLIANNTSNEPDTSATAWSLVASAGATGSQGPAGAAGAAGATGATGATGPAGPGGPQGVAGPTGPAGPQGLTWQGAWNISATYNLNDAAGYNGSSYISLAGGNAGNEPDTSPSAWSLVASAGTAGPASIYYSGSTNAATIGTTFPLEVAALSLPAGQYWLSAKVLVSNTGGASNSKATCSLFNAAQLLDAADTIIGPYISGLGAPQATLSLQAPLSVTGAVNVTVLCSAQGAGYYTQSQMLTAIQTGNLIVQPPVF
jgi:hypothetical protein